MTLMIMTVKIHHTKIKTGSGNLLPDLSIQLRTLLSARFDFVVIELLSPLLRIS